MTALGWMDDAACVTTNGFTFTEASLTEQQMTCSACPVRRDCREFAKATRTDRTVMYAGYRARKDVRS